MTGTDRAGLFDDWAEAYDAGLEHATGFPFEGYKRVLETVAQAEPGQRVLDVGTGTGELAAQVVARGGQVVGLDFSEAMLTQAKRKLPGTRFIKIDLLSADVSEGWSALKGERFDCVVSAYVFHEFPLETKVALLRRLSALLSPGGVTMVGNIAFADVAAREAARRQWGRVWDDSEHYWTAAKDMRVLEKAGFHMRYTQLSSCAGVFALRFDEAVGSRCQGQSR